MPHIDLDDIATDDIARLRADINDFFTAYDAYQWAYSEGEDWITPALSAEDRYDSLRRRIKNLAIDMGVHAEFLKEYSQMQPKLIA